MSRPNSSRPSQLSREGPSRVRSRLVSYGSYGARRGASRPARRKAKMITPPTSPARLRLNWRHTRAAPPANGRVEATSGRSTVSLIADPRIHHGVEDVHDKIDDDEGQRDDKHRCLYDGIVPRLNAFHH